VLGGSSGVDVNTNATALQLSQKGGCFSGWPVVSHRKKHQMFGRPHEIFESGDWVWALPIKLKKSIFKINSFRHTSD
jgi:hypothetical protein